MTANIMKVGMVTKKHCNFSTLDELLDSYINMYIDTPINNVIIHSLADDILTFLKHQCVEQLNAPMNYKLTINYNFGEISLSQSFEPDELMELLLYPECPTIIVCEVQDGFKINKYTLR